MKFEDVLKEATTSVDVTGVDTPHLIDWYGKKKKKEKDKIIKRQLNKIEKV